MSIDELEIGAYYFDVTLRGSFLIYDGEDNGYYWFYLTDENRHVAYYDFELENLRRY